ncbi:hypothetical protein GCM10007860_11440 [Chitiniphilus shinanonensis]|uniref:DUF4124 domain-containing protein n=1 Tax=Chitiniphilus shinanonensis TaxID=553088 RepID=A0ABQ6BPV7_9NEIS|nr:DUF4124 domain-containing protein [Chitiniphilus shinanonensis]GLS03998.1 hypothetical protein GCM10007860_11440 [Chitiniphilus shinanonensis]
MKPCTTLPLLALAVCIAAPLAHADIYKYVDEEGRVTFSNIPIKGSQRVYIDSISVIPAPKPRTKASGSASPKVNAPSPANFPKVDSATQKARDTNRRLILQEELSAEQRALDEARQSLAEAEGNRTAEEKQNPQKYVQRLSRLREAAVVHEKNVAALTSELGRLQ